MLTTLTLILHSGSRFLGARQDNGRVISGELDKSKDAKILISGELYKWFIHYFVKFKSHKPCIHMLKLPISFLVLNSLI